MRKLYTKILSEPLLQRGYAAWYLEFLSNVLTFSGTVQVYAKLHPSVPPIEVVQGFMPLPELILSIKMGPHLKPFCFISYKSEEDAIRVFREFEKIQNVIAPHSRPVVALNWATPKPTRGNYQQQQNQTKPQDEESDDEIPLDVCPHPSISCENWVNIPTGSTSSETNNPTTLCWICPLCGRNQRTFCPVSSSKVWWFQSIFFFLPLTLR